MELRKNLVVCIGSPMIDVTARVPREFLQKYQIKPNNAVAYDEKYFEIFDEIKEYDPTYTVGGSITNTAVALQSQMASSGVCCYIGAVGKDDFGMTIRNKLEECGMNLIFDEIQDRNTGRCAALLSDDDRSFVTDLEASKYLGLGFFGKDCVKSIIKEARYYYMSAFMFRISPEIVKKISVHSDIEKKVFAFNIGATFLPSSFLQEFKDVLPYVNILFGNEDESILLANALGCSSKDIEEISLFLHSHCYKSKDDLRKTLVVVTRGANSILMANNNEVKEFTVPVLRIESSLNTCGAGDYFVGGFLGNYIQNKSVDDSIESGIRLSCDFIRRKSLTRNCIKNK